MLSSKPYADEHTSIKRDLTQPADLAHVIFFDWPFRITHIPKKRLPYFASEDVVAAFAKDARRHLQTIPLLLQTIPDFAWYAYFTRRFTLSLNFCSSGISLSWRTESFVLVAQNRAVTESHSISASMHAGPERDSYSSWHKEWQDESGASKWRRDHRGTPCFPSPLRSSWLSPFYAYCKLV